MSFLQVSETDLTFEANQVVKLIKLTNNHFKPLIYKIKTNKLSLIDAKPACGYISGKEGQNHITINLRVLKSKQLMAKIQILYAYHEMITEQTVQKNQMNFDQREYQQFYDIIKTKAQNEVKCIYLSVIKKTQQKNVSVAEKQKLEESLKSLKNYNSPTKFQKNQAKVNQNLLKQTNKNFHHNISTINNQEKKQNNEIISLRKNTLINFLIIIFVIGILIGYSIGSYGLRPKENLNSLETYVQNQESTVGNTIENQQILNQISNKKQEIKILIEDQQNFQQKQIQQI